MKKVVITTTVTIEVPDDAIIETPTTQPVQSPLLSVLDSQVHKGRGRPRKEAQPHPDEPKPVTEKQAWILHDQMHYMADQIEQMTAHEAWILIKEWKEKHNN